MYLQINTVKYDADQKVMNIYKNLQIVWSQFVTDMLLFISIWSTSNIYWFIGIRIRCQWIQTNSYSVTFDICTIRSGIRWTNPKVKKQLFAVTSQLPILLYQSTYSTPSKDLLTNIGLGRATLSISFFSICWLNSFSTNVESFQQSLRLMADWTEPINLNDNASSWTML